jgi:hypothetical protein
MHKYTALVCPALGAVGGTLALLAATRQEVRCGCTSIYSIVIYCPSQPGYSGRYSGPSCFFRPRRKMSVCTITSVYCYVRPSLGTVGTILSRFLPRNKMTARTSTAFWLSVTNGYSEHAVLYLFLLLHDRK